MLNEIRTNLINLKMVKLKQIRLELINNKLPTLLINGEILNLDDKRRLLYKKSNYCRKV